MSLPNRVISACLGLSASLGCDQATKVAAQLYLRQSQPVELMRGVLRLESVRNPGFFLSVGADWPGSLRFWLFTIGAGGLLMGMFLLVLSSKRLTGTGLMAFSLIIGGGLSNVVDRLLHQGAVLDFAKISVGPFRTGIFNLADVAIVVGIAVFVSSKVFSRMREACRLTRA